MWVTLFDSTTEVERIFLQKPPPVELEVRFVVWTCSRVSLLPGYDYVNVRLSFALDCKEFFGDEPAQQWTDVHQNAPEGHAVFNWRVVYRRIKMPTDECSLTVNLYHYEALGETFIGSLNLDLKKHLERVQKYGDPVTTLPVDIPFQDNDYSSEDDDIGTINMEMTSMDRDLVSSFLSEGQEEGYAPQSGQIIGILEQLKETFQADMQTANTNLDRLQQGLDSTSRDLRECIQRVKRMGQQQDELQELSTHLLANKADSDKVPHLHDEMLAQL